MATGARYLDNFFIASGFFSLPGTSHHRYILVNGVYPVPTLGAKVGAQPGAGEALYSVLPIS